MSSRTRHIIGLTIVTGVIGFTIYAVIKYKQEKKAEEESISLEEAVAEVKERKNAGFNYPGADFDGDIVDVNGKKAFVYNDEIVNYVDESTPGEGIRKVKELEYVDELSEDEMEGIIDDCREMADWNASFVPRTYEQEGEDGKLRYEPSSNEALDQFIRMELAEWSTLDDTYATMLRLFDVPFNPKNDGDYDLKTRLIDYRVGFFGFESRWVQVITYADLVLHYARSATYNCDESVKYWVEYFLEFNELHHTIPSYEIDNILEDLNGHVYFNSETETFGLFGLTRDYMDSAIKIANRNVDQSVTYEIEFNEFLKSCM